MPNSIQPREYSKGGGMEGTLYIRPEPERQPQRPVRLRQRRQGRGELELARQQLQRQQPGWLFRTVALRTWDIGTLLFLCPLFGENFGGISTRQRMSCRKHSTLHSNVWGLTFV